MSYEKVNQPQHYSGNNSLFTVIDIIEAYDLNFSLGNVIKYGLRAGRKPGEDGLDDLKKAAWYLNREIDRVKTGAVAAAVVEAAQSVSERNSNLSQLGAYLAAGNWGAVRTPGDVVKTVDLNEMDEEISAFEASVEQLRDGFGDWDPPEAMLDALLRKLLVLYCTTDLESAAACGSLMDTLRQLVTAFEQHSSLCEEDPCECGPQSGQD